MTEWPLLFETARKDLGLSNSELWFRYFEVGGMATALQVEAFLYAALVPSNHDRDTLAVALNERFSEVGRDHPIPYSDDEPEPNEARVDD